jgi:hypothetical protein
MKTKDFYVVDGAVFEKKTDHFMGLGCKTPDTPEEWAEYQKRVDEYIKECENRTNT